MKKSLLILLVFSMLFSFTFGINVAVERVKYVEAQHIFNFKTVVLDAGHGGKDAGTNSADGTLEKDINLSIVLNLYDFLRFAGINAVMIRSDDTECYPQGSNRKRSDLYNRLDFINNVNNSMLVSIHQNHYENPSEWGMQVWYTGNDETSKLLADYILDISKTFLQPDNKRVNKQSDKSYYLLFNATVPSVMVECGFMSNAEENNRLKSTVYQKELSYTMLMGISKYFTGENNGKA